MATSAAAAAVSNLRWRIFLTLTNLLFACRHNSPIYSLKLNIRQGVWKQIEFDVLKLAFAIRIFTLSHSLSPYSHRFNFGLSRCCCFLVRLYFFFLFTCYFSSSSSCPSSSLVFVVSSCLLSRKSRQYIAILLNYWRRC